MEEILQNLALGEIHPIDSPERGKRWARGEDPKEKDREDRPARDERPPDVDSPSDPPPNGSRDDAPQKSWEDPETGWSRGKS